MLPMARALHTLALAVLLALFAHASATFTPYKGTPQARGYVHVSKECPPLDDAEKVGGPHGCNQLEQSRSLRSRRTSTRLRLDIKGILARQDQQQLRSKQDQLEQSLPMVPEKLCTIPCCLRLLEF
ncbi:hypothetical protein M427DRAFT_50178 [Gonapodya prolifera JEL478]|uniref:Uncharacterized protein n=1 Tax=Gonapodya prolifera (strain JEL478) TaxID=1344416 RepID=A0A138ZWQ2_GONPJ|nr:hypothetical protein M427DRAFT_50178 [Gonapodya prolifera JEL478]|eukprot:KXS08932.1 hypothetical protein M427DRAFT_50178 [Gonapodya prolifera JEL478]